MKNWTYKRFAGDCFGVNDWWSVFNRGGEAGRLYGPEQWAVEIVNHLNLFQFLTDIEIEMLKDRRRKRDGDTDE